MQSSIEWQPAGAALEFLVALQQETSPLYNPAREREDALRSNERVADELIRLHDPATHPKDQTILRSELVAEGIAAATRPTSPFEGPISQGFLNLHVPSVLAAVRALGFAAPSNVAIGTLWTGDINALAIRVPNENNIFVIAYSTGTFLYFEAISALFSRCIPSDILDGTVVDPLDGLSRVIDFAEESNASVSQNLSRILSSALDGSYRRQEGEQHRMGIHSSFSRSMGSFVLAHEFGHVILGHLQRAAVSERKLGSFKVQTLHPAWQDEFQADAFGARVAIKAMEQLGPLYTWAHPVGVPLALYAFELLERAANLGVDVEHTTHPPTEQRLYKLYEDVLGKTGFARAVALSEMVGVIVEHAWDDTANFLSRR
jgi:hypothetical protein